MIRTLVDKLKRYTLHGERERERERERESYLKSKEMVGVLFAEHELWAFVCVEEELGDTVPQPSEGLVARVPAEDGDSEVELEDQAPEHGLPVHLQPERGSPMRKVYPILDYIKITCNIFIYKCI